MSKTPAPYAGDAGDETLHPIDQRPIGVASAHRRIRKELEDNLAYARLYHKLCKKARNTEGIQQWEEQIDQLVLMLAELDKEERAARTGAAHPGPEGRVHLVEGQG